VLAGVGAVFAGGAFDGAGFEAEAAPGGQQGSEGGAADRSGQVDGAIRQDAGRVTDEVAGGLQQDGEADPVGVQAGPGDDGVGGGADEGLVDGEQGPDFLLDAGDAARAQYPPVQQGGLDRIVGRLNRPPLMPVKWESSLAWCPDPGRY